MGWELQAACGDVPSFFYRLLIPIVLAVNFGTPEVSPRDVYEALVKEGWTGPLQDPSLPPLCFRIAPRWC